ncbi:MAG: bifunctional DNA primase/polymerase [Proteobacteria bacterium]|nr:bifunctional DNA primase/polymerase [Pseudomonadota bacterium]
MTFRSDALASAAFRLALRGLAVFPLAPGAKVPPAGSHGHLEASSDPDVTRARWTKTPNANLGIVTGRINGLWALDCDPRHGGDKALAELECAHETLPPTVETSTPRGGRHLYWRWPVDGLEIRNSASRIGPGLDVRGEGGFITAPPSVLADGRRYRWVRNDARGFAEAPAWLLALALPPPPVPRPHPKPLNGDVSAYVGAAAAAELSELERTGEGCRNDALNRVSFALAGFVKGGALPEDWARGQLEARAVAIGLSVVEARRTIDSAFKAAQPRELPP